MTLSWNSYNLGLHNGVFTSVEFFVEDILAIQV